MKLYVLDVGAAHDMPREARVRTGAPFDPDDHVSIPVIAYLIEHPDGPILYDTGWSERHIRPWSIPKEKHVLSRLRELGYGPGDIKTVVMSHLHHDHSGALEFFTGSEIIVSGPEFKETESLCEAGGPDGLYISGDYRAWKSANLRWRLIPGGEKKFALADGIELLHFESGHCRGLLCMLLRLPVTGNLIIASDAIYCAENIGSQRYRPGVFYDAEGYDRMVDELLEYRKFYDAQLWFGHDMEQFESLVRSEYGCYE